MAISAVDRARVANALLEHPGVLGTSSGLPVRGVVPSAHAAMAAFVSAAPTPAARLARGALVRAILAALVGKSDLATRATFASGGGELVRAGQRPRVDHGRGTLVERFVEGPAMGRARLIVETGLGNSSWGTYEVLLAVAFS